jgi:quinol monooxygenase YgiN
MQPYIVVAHSKARPGQGDALYEFLAETVRIAFEAEPQLLKYAVSRLEGSGDEFLHIEAYESAEGFEFHQDSDHVARFKEQVADILDGEIIIHRSVAEPVSDDAKANMV